MIDKSKHREEVIEHLCTVSNQMFSKILLAPEYTTPSEQFHPGLYDSMMGPFHCQTLGQ